MFYVRRTDIASCVFISAPQLLGKKDKKKHGYGIDGVLVSGFDRTGGSDRGGQGHQSC